MRLLLAGAAAAWTLFAGFPADVMAASAPAPSGSRVLFRDRFASPASLKQWRVADPDVWSVVDGVLRAQLPDEKQKKSFVFAGSAEWTDYVVDVRVRGLRGVDKGVAVRVADDDEGAGVDLRSGDYQDVVMYRGWSKLGEAPVPNVNGRWYALRVVVRGDDYRVYVNGRLRLTARDGKHPNGGIALPAYTGGVGACIVEYDDVMVRSLAPLSSGALPAGEAR